MRGVISATRRALRWRHDGPEQHAPRGADESFTLATGVWLSRYEYFSSGRDASFVGLHYVVVLQHGDRLTVRSLPGSSDSPLTLDLTVDGSVVTGTWVEQTAVESYYRGARYHGAIQLLVDPTGHRMTGKWVGFGREMDVHVLARQMTGPGFWYPEGQGLRTCRLLANGLETGSQPLHAQSPW